jgi:hypothetical protein
MSPHHPYPVAVALPVDLYASFVLMQSLLAFLQKVTMLRLQVPSGQQSLYLYAAAALFAACCLSIAFADSSL